MIHKYNAKKTTYDGIQFPSKYESLVYQYLKQLEFLGEIHSIERQIKIVFFCTQLTKTRKNQITTIVDFSFIKNGEKVYVEAKGMNTPVFQLKKKLWIHMIRKPLIIFHGMKKGNPAVSEMICFED